MKQLSRPIEIKSEMIYYIKVVNSELPHYYIYDYNQKQVGGAIVGEISSTLKTLVYGSIFHPSTITIKKSER